MDQVGAGFDGEGEAIGGEVARELERNGGRSATGGCFQGDLRYRG